MVKKINQMLGLMIRNNGFLNYWTFNQLPLFVISFPIYWASFAGIWNYYRSTRFMTPKTQSKQDEERSAKELENRPFLNPRLQIHILIQLILTSLLLFNSHVQIILRQIATIPAFWWGLADGISRHWKRQQSSNQQNSHHDGHSYWAWWFPWIVVWAPISLVLWAGFYPPA
jgi:phosphatidylinositol glycan class V